MNLNVYITNHGYEYEGSSIDGVFESLDDAMNHVAHQVLQKIEVSYKNMDEHGDEPSLLLWDFFIIVTANLSEPTNVSHVVTLYLDGIEQEFYNRVYTKDAKRLTFENIIDMLYKQKDKIANV